MKKQYYRKALLALLSVIFIAGMLGSLYLPLSAADTTLYDMLMASESLEVMNSRVTNDAVQGFTKEQVLNLITRASALYYSLSNPTPEQGQVHIDLLQKYYNHSELVAERKAETDDTSYKPLTQTQGALSKGKYRLYSDLELTGYLSVAANIDVTIDLNGYAIIATTKNCIISLENSTKHAKLTIVDTNPTGNVHYFESSKTSSWKLLSDITDKTGYFMIPGGILTGGHNPNTSGAAGGAIDTGAGSKTGYKGITTFNGGTIVGNYSARGGGAAYGGKFVMEKGVIVGNYANKFAGAIAVSGVLEVKNGLIIDNNMNPNSKDPYAKDENDDFLDVIITTGEGSEFNFSGGEIFGNVRTVVSSSSPEFTKTGGTLYGDYYLMNGTTAVFSGGAVYGRVFMEKGSCTVTGDAIISNRISERSSAIHIAGAAKFKMDGGVICDSWAEQYGGAIYLASNENTECTISGGLIENCTASDGGAIYIKSGTMKVSGGEIRDNQATNGGAIYMGGGTLTMSGGTITQNTAQNGGAAYLESGTVTVSGGTLSNNQAIVNGGAAYLAGTGEMTVTGGTLIQNTAINNGGAAYLAGGTLEIGGTANIDKNTAQNGGAAYLESGTVTVSGGTLSNNQATVNGGAAYLAGTGTMTVTGGTLIQNTATNNGGAAYLAGGTLEIGGTANIEENTAQNGGAAYLESGTVTVSGGTLSNNQATVNGGAAYLGGGTLTINGGTLSENKAIEGSGGAAYVRGGDVIMTGGTMSQCTAAENGGAVCVEDGSFTISGSGSVDNSSAALGGAVYVSGGDANVNGGTLTGCSANQGGAIYVVGGTVTMLDGQITDNDATNGNGGAIYVTGSTSLQVTVRSGRISGNSATGNGGAICVDGQGTNEPITVQIGVNELHYDPHGTDAVPPCDHNGNNVYDDTCPVVEDNTCALEGGAIYITGTDQTYLNIFCITESGNRGEGNAADSEETSLSDFLKVDGGNVLISATDAGGNVYFGNSVIYSSIHVMGGDLTVKGTLTNPAIFAPITVDVVGENGVARGSFNDVRVNDEREGQTQYYVVRYFENYKENESDAQATGQYTVHQAPTDQPHTIWGVIYFHSGKTIVGWNTNPGGEEAGGKTFGVSSVVEYKDFEAFIPEDSVTLSLYAIWKDNFYWIQFDPNTESYTGTMGDAEHKKSYLCAAEGETLLPNQYVNRSYKFVGWATSPSGEKVYDDKQVLQTALTQEVGKVITLYAVWEICDHVDTERFVFAKVDESSMTCTCQCAYVVTATIVPPTGSLKYNGDPHPATVVYTNDNGGSFTENKITQKNQAGDSFNNLTISYDYEPIINEPGLVGNTINAGKYTAKVTFDGKTISVTFDITQATQTAPERPQFDVQTVDGKETLVVTKPSAGSSGSAGTKVKFMLIYVDGEGNMNGDVNDETKWTESASLGNFDASWTLYYVAAYYPGSNNYLKSDIAVSDQTYIFPGSISIIIQNEDGISSTIPTAGDDGKVALVTTSYSDYYLSSGYCFTIIENTVTSGAVVVTNDQLMEHFEKSIVNGVFSYKVEPFESELNYSGTITIKFEGAKKKPTVDTYVAPNENFGAISNTPTTVSQDSAFTAYFEVNYYDPLVYGDLTLSFDQALPVGATVIMIDKTDGSYWYAHGGSEAIKLTSFKKMGGGDETRPEASGASLKYQFIVDFSDESISQSSLTFELKATVVEEEKEYAPDLQEDPGSVSFTSVSHRMETPVVDGASATVEFGYAQGSAPASKWADREVAIVLTPEANLAKPLPIDVSVKVVQTVGSTTKSTTVTRDDDGRFVVPIDPAATKLEIILQSQMFENATYEFQVAAYAADKGCAPSNGIPLLGEPINLDLTTAPRAQNAAKITIDGDKRIYSLTDTISGEIKIQLAEGYTATATLLKKHGTDGYVSTGLSQVLSDGPNTLTISNLGSFDEGDFCLSVVIRDASNTAVLTVPYYLIIQK